MGSSSRRGSILVGLLAGVVAALCAFLFSRTSLPLLTETVLAVGAGVIAAYLVATRAPGGTRAGTVPSGALAGAVTGLLSAAGFGVAAYALLSSADFRTQMAPLADQAHVSVDSLAGIATGCVACVYLIILPAITAGLGALGGWAYGLTRPAPAPPPPPPPLYPPAAPLPPLPPPGSAG